jgi:hypothetical protein
MKQLILFILLLSAGTCMNGQETVWLNKQPLLLKSGEVVKGNVISKGDEHILLYEQGAYKLLAIKNVSDKSKSTILNIPRDKFNLNGGLYLAKGGELGQTGYFLNIIGTAAIVVSAVGKFDFSENTRKVINYTGIGFNVIGLICHTTAWGKVRKSGEIMSAKLY